MSDTRSARPRPLILAALLLVAACSAAPEGAAVHDPYEARNRAHHATNQALVARAPDAEAREPGTLSRRIGNVGSNLGAPRRVVNDLLQARPRNAVENAYRFVVNSTVGLGGLFDPAARMGAPGRDTDFGETLYVWGAPEGAYLEVPLLGPATERRMAGRVVDVFLDPLGPMLSSRERNIARGLRIGGGILSREAAPDIPIPEDADSYTRARLLYLYSRRAHLGDASHPPLAP